MGCCAIHGAHGEVKNAFHEDWGFEWFDCTLLLGMMAALLGLAVRNIANSNLFPIRDPKLRESLKFTNI